MFKFANDGEFIKEDLSGVFDGINEEQSTVGGLLVKSNEPVDDNPF